MARDDYYNQFIGYGQYLGGKFRRVRGGGPAGIGGGLSAKR